MNTSVNTERRRPWYREVWPWLLMLPPAFSIVGGVTMIYLANSSPSALVVEDYARIDEITSERFDRDREAAELGLTAELSFGGSPARVEVTLEAPASFRLPRTLTLFLRHATDAGADRELELTRSGSVFMADLEALRGRYRIELMPVDRAWRLGGPTSQLLGKLTLEPQVEFSVRAFDTAVKQIVWSSSSYGEGDDRVFFFDAGRVPTAHRLSSEMTKALVERILPSLEVSP